MDQGIIVDIQQFIQSIYVRHKSVDDVVFDVYVLYDVWINEYGVDISLRDVVSVTRYHRDRILKQITFMEIGLESDENPDKIIGLVRDGAEAYANQFSPHERPQSAFHELFMEKIIRFDDLYGNTA